MVQRWRPAGAVLQASAIRRAGVFSSSPGLFPGARPFLPRLQALFAKALAGAFDRGAPDGEGDSNGAVLYTLGCFPQDTGTGHFAGRVRPTMQPVFKLLALIVMQCDTIFFLGDRWSSSCA